MSDPSDRYPTGTSFYRDGVLYVAFHGCSVDTAEGFIRGVNALVDAAQALKAKCDAEIVDYEDVGDEVQAIFGALEPFTRAASDAGPSAG